MSNQHVLKIHPAPLADLLSGAKTAEVRRNDRGFQVGDTVRLMEVNPETLNWTGRTDLVRTISHIQTGYGLPGGMCVLSYADTAQREALARVETERDAVLAKAPTQWAYDQACTALHKQRELANTAQALLREVDAYLSGHGDNAICNGPRLHQDIKHLLAGQLAVAGTTSDQYRAELYDEVWQKARDMGYGNVTEALIALERTKPAAGEPLVPIGYVSNHAAQDLADGKLCTITPDRMLDDGQGWEVPVYTAPSAAAHEDDVVAVVGTVPDGSGFKSLDFKVDLQDLPDGTRLYAMGRGGAPT